MVPSFVFVFGRPNQGGNFFFFNFHGRACFLICTRVARQVLFLYFCFAFVSFS